MDKIKKFIDPNSGWFILTSFVIMFIMTPFRKNSTFDDIAALVSVVLIGLWIRGFYVRWRGGGGRVDMSNPVVQAADQILKGTLPVITNSPIARQGETTHLYCQAIRFITKNRVVGRTASTAGVSVRVAKGVSVRTGGIKGHSVYGDVTATHEGEFVLTNKRVIFVHGQHGFQSTLATLDAVSELPDGKVILQKGNTSCVLALVTEWDRKRVNPSIIRGAQVINQAISLVNSQRGNTKDDVLEAEFFDDDNTVVAPTIKYESTSADEIMKFKVLLDSGAITENEYETKKKQLLGL